MPTALPGVVEAPLVFDTAGVFDAGTLGAVTGGEREPGATGELVPVATGTGAGPLRATGAGAGTGAEERLAGEGDGACTGSTAEPQTEAFGAGGESAPGDSCGSGGWLKSSPGSTVPGGQGDSPGTTSLQTEKGHLVNIRLI